MIKILCAFPSDNRCRALDEALKSMFDSVVIRLRNTTADAVLESDRDDYGAVLLPPETDGDFDGLELAKKIRLILPKTKIVFLAQSAELAVKAFKTRADGYLVNPTLEELKAELSELGIGCVAPKRARAVTFGNFDLFADGQVVKFSKSKSKELIAFLIYKRGTSASSSELIVNLWEDRDVDRTTRSMLHNYLADIRKTLEDYGISDIFAYERNSYRIVTENISCDYFAFLRGDKKAIRSYAGEFMSEYEWAVYTAAELTGIQENLY